MTYRELDARVDRLAQWLLDSVGGPDRRIGLHTTGTEALVVGSLGLRRAGMVSVCLDPTAPAPWVGRALADCGAVLLLSDSAPAVAGHPLPRRPPVRRGRHSAAGRGADGNGTDRFDRVHLRIDRGAQGCRHSLGAAAVPRVLAWLGWRPRPRAREGLGSVSSGFGSVGFMESVVHLGMALDATLVGYDVRTDGIHGLGKWLVENRIWAVVAVPTLLRHVLATLPTELQMPALQFVVALRGGGRVGGPGGAVAARWPGHHRRLHLWFERVAVHRPDGRHGFDSFRERTASRPASSPAR